MSNSNNNLVFTPERETPQASTKNIVLNFDQSLSHVDIGHSIEQSMKSAQKEMHQKRIQALRKELDHLKSTEWEFDTDKGFFSKNEELLEDREDYLAEQLLELEATERTDTNVLQNPVDVIPRSAVCFQRTGVIKFINDDRTFILIDGTIYFDCSSCSIQLYVNDKIEYLAYKDSNDSIVVVRIIENYGTSWGDEEENEENTYKLIEHTAIGEVDHREDRYVVMKDNDLKFNIDDVKGTFIPAKGDWLELTCNVQWNEDKPSDVSAAQVVQVLSFKALRFKVKEVTVTDWSGECGACDRQFYFNKQSLQNGIVPTVGSKVIVEAIESNQGRFTWRVIKLIIVHQISVVENAPNIHDNEFNFDLEKERNLDVTYPLKFEEINFLQTSTINLIIKNNSKETYSINKWVILSKKRDSQVNIKPILSRPVKLDPEQIFTFQIKCTPKFLGHSRECLIIMFRGFQIKRFIEINVINKIPSIHNNTNVTSERHFNYKSYNENIQNMKKIRRNGDKECLPGVKLVKPPAFVPTRLGVFPIPQNVWSTILGDSEQTILTSDYYKIIQRIEMNLPCLTQDLNINNYIDKWHTLLYMEEVQLNINMRTYDTPKAFLIRCQEYLGIELKGLSERRPSLVKGDRAIVKDVLNDDISNYEGFIHFIRGDLILMKFNPRFHESYTGSDVSVEFHFSRTCYRKCHQAINFALSNLGPDVLFPSRILSRPPQIPHEKLDTIKWYNKQLNNSQKSAITNILLGQCRPTPYCIYGPPGTGKTVTVTETILQILSLMPDSRILVATPSNSAANLITERLIKYRNAFSDSILRLIANHLLDSGNIPDAIKPFCATLDIAAEGSAKSKFNVTDEGINLHCHTSFVGRHRVTVGTCMSLGTLVMMGLPKGHFTHVIVDEAGQATEPEIMIPMTFIDKESGQIIIAGDPMQLGPVVMSKYCVEFGMNESYLCRLLDTFPYHKDFDAFPGGFNPKLVTKLIDNYRSLKEVLTLPSDMFYDGSLLAQTNRNQPWILNIIETINKIFDKPDTKTGGIFVYGIRGKNTKAEDSPSWYNPQEAMMLALTTCKLLKNRNISADEIGVITPYVAQVKYLRILFEAMGLPLPKIGTVEEFQGQERQIILISTVRSTDKYLREDQKHALGFVQNPKKLNVAITRAQVAVILFCDPHLLSIDPMWNNVLKHSISEDKYMGCDLPYKLCNYNEEH